MKGIITMSINIHAFHKQFQKEYEFLYENRDRVAGYEEAVDAFCLFLNSHFDFVCEFANLFVTLYRNQKTTSI